MNGIVITVLAQVLIGVSLVADKILLNHHYKSSRTAAYVFWMNVLNALAIFMIPFGFEMPDLRVALLAIAAGIAFFLMTAVYYTALAKGEASGTLPIVGGFAPIATYFLSNIFMLPPLNIAEKIAFGLMAGGGFLLFISERFNFRKMFVWITLAATTIGFANVLQKLVFSEVNFVTGFVLMKFGTLLAALSVLILPHWRRDILDISASTPNRNRILYFANRIIAGLGSILIFYAIKLEAHPELVEALNGTRFIIIFVLAGILSWWRPKWLSEMFHGSRLWIKIAATIIIVAGLMGLGLQRFYEGQPLPKPENIQWGITFSTRAAQDLGLKPQETLSAILNDLRPAGIRLMAPWDTTEPEKGGFSFSALDWQMQAAQYANIPVILAIGQKTPRWPECHIPPWAEPAANKSFGISGAKQTLSYEIDLLNYIETVVKRYRGYPNLLYWQVENEPFLIFGECPSFESATLDKEIALVRTLDPQHPILLTDSGEFGGWYRAATRADVFGTTLYRKVYSKIIGHITYPLTSQFYQLKTALIKWLMKKPAKKFIVVELGLEPWGGKQISQTPLNEQMKLFSIEDFNGTIDYALGAGFDTYYLWGAEWWYWLKTAQNNAAYWNAAEKLTNP